MLSPGPTTRIFVGLDPLTMRGSFHALTGHVGRLYRRDPSAKPGGGLGAPRAA